MSVYSRRFFSVLIVFVISLLYIFNSFASTAGSATPSDATQVKDKQFDIATSSNAMPSDDFWNQMVLIRWMFLPFLRLLGFRL